MVHRGELEWIKIGGSVALSLERDEQVAFVQNVVLSQEDEIWSAIVTTPN